MKKMIAFLLTLAAVLSAAQLEDTARAVEGKVLRMHILAASDSAEDQALKLMARDAVLEYLAPLLADCSAQSEAQSVTEANLEGIAAAAAQASGQRATVGLVRENFPQREYDGFALPAGEYLALRIELEEGKGHNWWCVVFPPLCQAITEEDGDAFALFTGEETKLISGEGRVFKFRIIEWINKTAGRIRG